MSIVETIIAMFILVGAVIYCSQLFAASFRAQARNRDEALAVLACERRIDEIRMWARKPAGTNGGYNFDGEWPSGVTDGLVRDGASPSPAPAPDPTAATAPFARAADPDNPQFKVEAQAWKYVTWSPARGMRDAARMQGSMRMIRVTAAWGEGRELSVVALVPEPPRRLQKVALTSRPTVDAGTYADLAATATDTAARGVEDLVYRWYVAPIDANGTLCVGTSHADSGAAHPTREDTSSARFWNFVTYPNGAGWSTTGRCRIRVRTACDGQELWTDRVSDDSVLTLTNKRAVSPNPVPEACR